MTRLRTTAWAAAALACLASVARAEEGPSLTVYSSADPAGFDPQQFVAQQRTGQDPTFAWQVPGFGVVKEVRKVDVPAGEGVVRFVDVAQFIDPTTVSFVDLTDPQGTSVLEQAFQFDLASPDKILERYVDRTIGYERRNDAGAVVEKVEGTVLSVNQGTVIFRAEDGLRFLSTREPGLRLPSLPDGLLTRPTLLWKVRSEAGGSHDVRTTYQTAGLTWRADYNLVLDASDAKADVSAWVSLLNLSGAGWKDVRLKLIAGDVQRVLPVGPPAPMAAAAPMEDRAAGFEEKAFFEYHLYTLPRRTDVPDKTTQQITLFPTATGVAVEKVMVYYGLPDAAHWGAFPRPATDRNLGSDSNPKVDVYLRWKNAKENRMGMPLPKGKVRVYKQDDADGTLEFVGEDLIDHTPRDETVQVRLGQAFDVVGTRTQVDFRVDAARRTMTDSYRIELRNHKDAPAKVVVKENLFRWTQWEVLSPSHPFTKVDARTVHFDVEVPAHGVQTVTYTARYTW
jgi:hypothetical protein